MLFSSDGILVILMMFTSLQNPVEMEQMSQLFMSRQEAYVADALAPFGLSVDLIGVALKKFETSQQLGEIWAAGQARQQMELRKLGF